MAPRLRLFFSVCLLALGTLPASATLYNYQPGDRDIDDLDHYSYYTWGIRDNSLYNELSNGYVITGATLTIRNIHDWTYEQDDLYIHLLDNPRNGVREWTDNQGGGDYFANAGPLVGHWSDPYGDPEHKVTLSYDFAALGLLDDLMTCILNPPSSTSRGHFGFGIDPDCHYFNDGFCFNITTAPDEPDEPVVPEPATLGLLGLGLSGLGLVRRKRTLN